MLGRPDSQSFTRLLVSVGAALLVAAFIGPGWVLRDTGTLRVTRAELGQLTPAARQAMIHRQHVAADAGKWAPWAILILGALGAGLIVVGALRLLPQERVEREHASAQKDLAKRQLSEQSPREIEKARRDEVDDQLPTEQAAGAAVSAAAIRRLAIERIRRTGEVEQQVLERLHAIADVQGGEVRDYPSFHAPNRITYRPDALIIPSGERSQILVEVKYRPKADPGPIGDGLRQVEEFVAAFEATFPGAARGWLIIVAESIDQRDVPLTEARASLYERLAVTLIRPNEIESLELPPE